MFHLDSDDWLEDNALELLLKKKDETNADIVIGAIRNIWKRKTTERNCPQITDSTNVTVWYLLTDFKYFHAKLYRKQFFMDYVIPTSNLLEDAIVNLQIFSHINREKVVIVDTVIYNYDHRTNGIVSRTNRRSQYTSFLDYPFTKPLLWMEKYLTELNCDAAQMSAFAYFFLVIGVVPFLRHNSNISKREIKKLYTKYYVGCSYKHRIRIIDRIMLRVFCFSVTAGKIYVALLDVMARIKQAI